MSARATASPGTKMHPATLRRAARLAFLASLSFPEQHPAGRLLFEVPGLRLDNPLNGSHGWWRGSAANRRKHSKAVSWALALACPGTRRPFGRNTHLVVTITRIGPRSLDGDAVPAAAKTVRDEIAAWAGRDDRETDGWTWRYAQDHACIPLGEYAVRVEISWQAVGTQTPDSQ